MTSFAVLTNLVTVNFNIYKAVLTCTLKAKIAIPFVYTDNFLL